jgi:hypothetical protein
MTSRRHFVFLVFNDPVVVGIIDFLSSVLNDTRNPTRPHITIQGPFEDQVGNDAIAGIKNKLAGELFFIGNPGLFRTSNGIALYLSVVNNKLKSVWNKPDFPVAKFGLNAHVTLYEGSNIILAQHVCDYLKKYRIELLCRDFDVIQYVPKQIDMFPQESVAGDENAISQLIGRGKLPGNFRIQLLNIVNQYKNY